MVDQNNKKVKDVDLPGLFSTEVRPHLMHAAVVNHLANKRAGTASTKNKALVSGGGAKAMEAEGNGQGALRKQPLPALEARRHLLRSHAERLLLCPPEKSKAGCAR